MQNRAYAFNMTYPKGLETMYTFLEHIYTAYQKAMQDVYPIM